MKMFNVVYINVGLCERVCTSLMIAMFHVMHTFEMYLVIRKEQVHSYSIVLTLQPEAAVVYHLMQLVLKFLPERSGKSEIFYK